MIQRETKCLVVLDDIWTTGDWSALKAGFPINENSGSRILLTTRNEEVGYLQGHKNCYRINQPIDNEEAWHLFEKIAFSERHDSESEICAKKKQLGQKMLQHCAGLPLVISLFAGILAFKNTVYDLDAVENKASEYIRRGTDLEKKYEGKKLGGASWVLALSYDDLPYGLKLCFLYLGHFPEDYDIPVKRLTQLWIAEGFISLQSQELNSMHMLEDVSYSCLRELVGRCMVRVGKNGSTDKIKTCHLHNVVRDFCLFKAKQENFLHIINSLEAGSLGRVRRLAIHLNKEADKFAPARDERESHLRSLLYSASAEYCMAYRNEKVIRSLFNDFKFLRVLKIEGIRGESSLALPRTIGSLVHLKLLSLKNSFIKRLPSSVSNLMSLQTLDLRVHLDAFMMAIPNVTGKMKTLRHLYLPSTYKKVSGRFRLASLGNMQTLVNVSSHHCDLNDLATLTNLRKLSMKVVDLQNLEEVLKCTSIVSHRLRSLSVDSREKGALEGILSSCHHILKLRLIGPIRELPENLHMNHPNLAKIMLEGTDLKDNQMEILEKLPSLRMLYLGTDAAFKSWPGTMVCSREGFPRLEFLSLNSLSKLKEWKVEEGAMPRLGRLHIENCKDLAAVPDGIRYITTLQELSITRMHSEFCARLVVQGEDFYKIQHVPFVHMF